MAVAGSRALAAVSRFIVKPTLTSLALVVMAITAFGKTVRAKNRPTIKAIKATMPTIRSIRKRSKFGTASFLFFLTFGTAAAATPASAGSSSSISRVSTSSPVIARPASSPTGRLPAVAVIGKDSGRSAVSSTVSSWSSNKGASGISGLVCSVLATCKPTAPASGSKPASLVISTMCFLALSALRLSSFMLTMLWKTLARLGKTKARILPSLARTLSMMPVISSSMSM